MQATQFIEIPKRAVGGPLKQFLPRLKDIISKLYFKKKIYLYAQNFPFFS